MSRPKHYGLSLRLPWYNGFMFERALTAITAGAIAILVVVINTTDPSTTGPTGILAVFFLLYVVFLGTFTWWVREVWFYRKYRQLPSPFPRWKVAEFLRYQFSRFQRGNLSCSMETCFTACSRNTWRRAFLHFSWTTMVFGQQRRGIKAIHF